MPYADNIKTKSKSSIKLAGLFKDHAVLQQGMSVPVWGWTRPLANVVVSLGPYTAQSLSGDDSRFLVRLPPMKAGGPYRLEAYLPESGEKAVSEDIWVGEVWLASGQSNMEFTFTMLGQENSACCSESFPGIRMAKVATSASAGKKSECCVSWEQAGPDTTYGFSAAGFYFAKILHKTLEVPVGIINSSWGGTMIESWTSREALIRNEDMRAWIQRYESDTHSPAFWQDLSKEKEAFPPDPGNKGFELGWADRSFDDGTWGEMTLPGAWTSHGHKYSGVFWFRKYVDIPQAWAGMDLILSLGAADKQDVTYFNGKQVGATGSGLESHYWNKLRIYRIPGRLVKEGRNVIAVRVYSFAFDGGLIGPGKRMSLSPAGGNEALSIQGEWKYNIEHNFGTVIPPSIKEGHENPNSPYMLYDNMIAPLIPYTIRGVIWYQGESNAKKPETYLGLMKALIKDWRYSWGQGDFQFIMVQLPNFKTELNWPLIREAQLKALSEPNTGMAVAIDCGDPLNIHPSEKEPVGSRLALWALAGSYGKGLESSGPLYSSMTIEGNRIRVRFSHTAGGLFFKGGKPKTFVISGDNRKFYDANAEADGSSIVVSSPAVSYPVAVRYAWDSNPEGCNLYNGAGLPASPFRTDNW